MQRVLTLFLFVLGFSIHADAQLLFEDSFNYTAGTTLVSNGWVAHSGAGTNSLTVNASSLTYPAYPSSGVGGSITLATSGEDVDSALTTAVTSGNVFASVLVRVDSATSAGDYFFHFIANTRTSNTFMARAFAKKAANGNLSFGISKSSTAAANPPVYADSIYSFGTTYLLVIKYGFVDVTTSDDYVSLFVFVNPTLPATEPAPTVGPITTTQSDATSIAFIAIRQGTAAQAPILTLDGVRVGATWNNAPLPVQLASFTARRTAPGSALLNWRTVSETNNYGFYVQRRSQTESAFLDIPGSFIPGNGTTSLPRDYSYTDNGIGTGSYQYRLRQVDLNGDEHFSDPVQLEGVTSVSSSVPATFALQQNYPNPFNPSTTIRFTVERSGPAVLTVYNLLGQQVATLFNGSAESGREYNIEFNASALMSGVYFYKLETASQSAMRKLTLLK